MAEKEVKQKEEKPAKEKKQGSKKKLLIIIVLLVAAGAAAAIYFLMPRSEKPIVYGYYSPGEYFVTNVNNSNRLLKVSVVLVLNSDDAGLQSDLTAKNSQIRDTLIFIFRDLGEEDIKSAGSQDNLRENIVESLNNRLEIDNIVGVLFNDFVMQ